MVLVAQDVISRELVIEYFQELFSTKLEKEYSYIWTSLVINSTRLYPFELKEYIDQTFEADLVDVFFINQKSIDSCLESVRNAVMKELREHPHYRFIEDTISSMEWWACFKDEKEKITATCYKTLHPVQFSLTLSKILWQAQRFRDERISITFGLMLKIKSRNAQNLPSG